MTTPPTVRRVAPSHSSRFSRVRECALPSDRMLSPRHRRLSLRCHTPPRQTPPGQTSTGQTSTGQTRTGLTRTGLTSWKSLRIAKLAVLALLGSACEIEKAAIARPPAQLALHGMLSVTAPSQVVLLEHTRNGSVQLIAPPFDVTDPVVSDEGIAETGALMTLQAPSGELYIASEDNTTRVDGKGQGIYRFALPGSALKRNAPYRLTVNTKSGATLTAE